MAPGPVEGRGIEERWAGLTTRRPTVMSSWWLLCGGRPSLPSASWVSRGADLLLPGPWGHRGLGQSQCRAERWALLNLLSSHWHGCRQGPSCVPSAGRVTLSRRGGGGAHVPALPQAPCCFWGAQGARGCARGRALLPSAHARLLPLCLGAQAPPSVHPSAVCIDVSAPFRPQASHGRV